MKHLKKLSVVLMMTTLFSVSFTSCIDNEVSPVVEAIYEAQADLIAAQAGVQNAEAALLLAQANAAQAQADYTDAQAAQVAAYTAGIIADNAYEAAQRVQYLLQLVAQTNLNVTVAENNLALAQIQFETDMAYAIAQMEAAGAQIAVGYAYDYRYAMQAANDILLQKLNAEAALAQAELMLNGGVSWEFFLAQLEGTVATKTAAKADLVAAIADLQAYIANPTTPEAVLSGLKDQSAEYQAAIDAKLIELAAQMTKIDAIDGVNDLRNELVDNYEAAKADLDYAVSVKESLELDIVGWQEDIAIWQLALDDYPAALALLQADVTAAQDAVDAAQIVFDAAVTTQANADAAQIAADGALTFLEGELAQLYAALQTAANDLAAEQAIYDAGIGTATSNNVAAIAAVTSAQGALTIALANYASWKAIFEANPAGSTWFDEVTVLGTLTAGADGYPNTFIGNHTDMIGTSYRQVLTWVEGPVGEFYPATYAATSVAAIPADVLPLEDYEEYTAALYPNGINTATPTVVFFVEVENDDVSETNVDILNAMVAALGDEDIFDAPPVLGDLPLAGTDAYTNLWNAQLAQLGTQDTLDNFGNNLAAALVEYNYWKNLYENELTLLDAAQATLDAADIALAAADSALATATTTLTDANTDLSDADAALLAFEATTEADLQDWIDGALANIAAAQLEITNIVPVIAAYQAILDDLQVEYDAYIASEGSLSGDPAYSDLHAELIAEWQVYWVMEQELAVLENSLALNEDLIDAYGTADDLSDLADYLVILQDQLVTATYDLEVAQQALATAQVNEAAAGAYITYLEALVDTLEQRYANALAIAAKFKALMDAALAS
ncbi:MAG: hypothetical protein Q7T92_09835 [Lutibacter sp.]|nr:hypothetical protein [Lutibacter sp.]